MTKKRKVAKKEKNVVSTSYPLNAYRDLIVMKDEKNIASKQLTTKGEKTLASQKWTIGESVVVKPGVKDPDNGDDIAGWQGRILAVFDEEEEEIVQIQWDSVTLRNMSDEHIAWCEEDCLCWSEMNLGSEEVESATERDTEEEVEATIEEISSWAH
jgi:hypothetical protein